MNSNPDNQAAVALICADEELRLAITEIATGLGLDVAVTCSPRCYLEGEARGRCVVADLSLPEWAEVEFELVFRESASPVIGLAERRDIAGAVRAMQAGARDVIEKNRLREQFAASLQRTLHLPG